ncbi:transglycosylase SLT domain-containing protein [Streptomyces xanthochromogenes]|uniref:transglycosylase SLT domain-containing protein n=1 Tax=Streptomyces xanthochromogenes TaxID=67384 RepID=UPI002F414DB3
MAISVGSVEVDVIPNTQGIYQRLRNGLVPAATRAGDDAGQAAGRAFGPAMSGAVSNTVATRIGEQIGSQIAARIAAQISGSLRDGVTRGGQTARPAATRQGDETGGAFGRAFRLRLEAAMKNLPKADVRLSDTGFDADMARLRTRLETLSSKRIGVDVDAAVALAEIDKIEADLKRLGAAHPDVNVRVNTAASIAELEALRAEIARLDGQDVKVDVDTSSAAANFNLLTTAALAFGPAILPVLPVVAAGLGAVTAAAVGAGVGLAAVAAVAIPALKSIAGALQAQKAAQQASTAATTQGTSKALQMAGAQQALASAHRAAAYQIQGAQDQVKQAERGVVDAERSLADAQKASRQAQLDLTSARKAAAQQLEDLANSYVDAQLSQRDATLSLAEAQAALKKSLADPKATVLERKEAQLAYDQAVQRLKEQTTATARLKDQQTAAAKSGVEGTDIVRQAQDKLAQSQRTVADQAQAVADAQDKVAKANANVANVQAQAADSIASAQRQIAQAQQSAAGSASTAETAQQKYQDALDKLTPSARTTFYAFLQLRDAFSAWSTSLQPTVMPIFTRALIGLKNSLPGLTPVVYAAADAIGKLQDRVSRGFKSPWWQSFKRDLATSVEPALVGLGISFGLLFKGMAGIVDAFFPHMDSIAVRMERITGRFATWGTSLKGSPEFERFLDYASTNGPIVSQTLRKITDAFFDLSRALGPISQISLQALQILATGVSWVATNFPGAIQLMYGLFVATRLWAGAQLVAAAATTALTLATKLSPWGWVITALVAVTAAVVYAYNHFTWFRVLVQAAWQGIAAGATWLWQTVLQPVFSAIWTGLQTLGGWAMWLWTNAIQPAWNAIQLGARILFAVVLTVLITPLYLAFKLVGGIAVWLWQNAIQPAFEGIATVAVWLYQNVIGPYFDFIVAEFRFVASIATWLWNNALAPAFRGIGAVATWLWQNAIQPAFDGIASVATWLYDHGLRPVFDNIKSAVGLVGDAFDLAQNAIGIAWGKVHDIVKKPVQFIVDTVYNKGIRPVWNAVAKIVHLNPLDEFTFATGGILPGYTPGRDVHLAALSGGEAVMRPEWTRAVGPQYVESMNAAARGGGVAGVQQALGLPGFSDGGIFGGLSKFGGWIKSGFNKGVDLVEAGVDLFSDPSKAWNTLIKPILSSVTGGVGSTPIGKAVGGLPKHMLDGLLGLIKKTVASVGGLFGGGSTGAPSGSGVTRWTPQVIQALAANGLSTSPDMVQRILRQIQTESGGNEKAVQGNIGDINNRTGDLAKGLMQTISATFNAYKFPGHGDIFNGYDNLLAALNYAKHRYGPGLSFLGQGHGYDSGGYLQPGMNLAYNGTGRPEPVFTTQQANALTQLAVGAPAGGGGLQAGDSLTLVVDGQEFHGYVDHRADGRVHDFATHMATSLGAGRRS